MLLVLALGGVYSGVSLQAATTETNAPVHPLATNACVTIDTPVVVRGPDAKRLFALGMIETGNDDREVGSDGEVSRYQIQPVVWKTYTTSTEYRNPEVALSVARQHWNFLAKYFKDRAGREPDDFDMYILWNTRFGYYSRKGFEQGKVSLIIQDRAQRFVNLVNRKG
jgi:hypothetical protein